MRKNLIFLGLLAAVFLGPFAFGGRCEAPANGAQAIRKATAAYLEAMNKGDLDGIMAYWAPDADFIDEAGKTTRGHDASAALFMTTLPALKGCKIAGEVYSAKFLRPDVALMDGSRGTTSADGTRDPGRRNALDSGPVSARLPPPRRRNASAKRCQTQAGLSGGTEAVPGQSVPVGATARHAGRVSTMRQTVRARRNRVSRGVP